MEFDGHGLVDGTRVSHGPAAADVIILDGDGSLLMNLNSLPTAAARKPQNLIHVVWDNRQFELTGGQPTHTATCANLAELARASGFGQVVAVETQDDFEAAFSQAYREPGRG